ncbi:YiiG family protein [Stenotrophomonas maltophilia]|uniref:YiiG family protein n=1 Tax=Stenotrophomonas maltophilia TaxID=40324 RepID=UPI00289397A6|nr:YiiG family protein [Stenotrophomonas maltophilia]MDT3500410.1 YiiG family protein [Stenotrophomonas maltophilia]
MKLPVRIAPLLLLGALAGVSGCNRSPVLLPADPALEKLNAYIECYNGVGQPIHEGFETYSGWMKDPAAGPTGKEATPRSPGRVLSHRVEYCGQPLTDALALMPASELDGPAHDYQQAFKALYAQIEHVDGYFSREDHRRDGGEGLRAQHAPLMQAYAAFFTASDVLDAALEKQEEARRVARLQQIEDAEGRSLAYYHLRLLGDGKQLAMAFQGDAPDLAALRAQLANYQTLVTEIRKSGLGKDDPMWGHVQRSADKLVRTAGRAAERLEQGKPITAEGLAAERKASGSWDTSAPEGAQSTLLDAYNDLVSTSNRLR